MIKFNQKIKSGTGVNYFITSDLHFFHKRIMEFCPNTRPWSSVEEMNEALIKEWNETVGEGDVVFDLGDFSFGNKEQTLAILDRLNGEIVHIYGNHSKVLRDQIKINGYDYLEVSYDKVKLILNHYPLTLWNRSHYGSISLYGHVHGSYQGEGKTVDCGYDKWGKILPLEEAIAFCTKREIQHITHK